MPVPILLFPNPISLPSFGQLGLGGSLLDFHVVYELGSNIGSTPVRVYGDYDRAHSLALLLFQRTDRGLIVNLDLEVVVF